MERSNVSFGEHGENGHKCYSAQEGDWIVFRCPVCDDYERRIHIKTGEMQSHIEKDNQIPHHGFYMKPGLDNLNYSIN